MAVLAFSDGGLGGGGLGDRVGGRRAGGGGGRHGEARGNFGGCGLGTSFRLVRGAGYAGGGTVGGPDSAPLRAPVTLLGSQAA